MFLGEVDSQTNSIVSICNTYIEEMVKFRNVIFNFTSQESLRGKAYQAAKTYFNSVYIPLANGVIMASEAIIEANKKFPDAFRAEVDGNDVIEEQLIAQIKQTNSLIDSYTTVQTISPSISMMVATLRALKLRIERKLERLYAFNGKSPTFFNDAKNLLNQVESGIIEISSGRTWNASTNMFSTDSINMDWARTLNQRWDENVESLEEEALKYMHELERKLPDVTEEDVKKLLTMTKHCPDVEVPETLLEFLIRKGPEFVENLEEELKSTTISDFTAKTLETSGGQVKSISQLIAYYSATWGPENTPNSFIMMSPEQANKLNRAVKIGNTIKNVGRILPAVGSAIDFGTQLYEGEDVTDAAIKTGAHVAIGLAGGKAGVAIGAAIGSVVPVAGTAVGAAAGFVIGVGITAIGSATFDFLYDNREEIYESVKATVNSVGEKLNNVGKEIGKGVKKAGKAVAGFFSGLGSAFA